MFPLPVCASQPLTDWFDGITLAAARVDSDPTASEKAARSALIARPAGAAGARALLALGVALRGQGRVEDAGRLLRVAARETRDPWLALAAGAAEREASSTGSRTNRPRSAEGSIDTAAGMVSRARPRDALALLQTIAPEAPAERARAAALRALALHSLGRSTEASQAARQALETPGADAGTLTAARLVLARIASRERRFDEAIELYRQVAGHDGPVPGISEATRQDLAGDASFLTCWLLYDAGRYREAAAALTGWALRHPEAKRVDDARWFAAWSLVRDGDRPGALSALSRISTGPLAAGALYWRGRLAASRPAQRRLLRRALGASGPEGWYGQLAAARLRSLGTPVRTPRPAASAPPGDGAGAGPAGRALARAVDLYASGLAGPARAALVELSLSPTVRPVAARLAQLAEASSDLELPARMARDHLLPSRQALRWSHPDGAPGHLPGLAAAAGVDRFLLLAVMRKESGFRPTARSAAGAEGLLQLLPATADRLATAAALSERRTIDLADSETAVALGAWYFSLLTDRFGSGAAAVAAYNAGPSTVAVWAEQQAGQPLDEWVENLGFRETRRYVKAVLADANVYRWLRRGGPLEIDGSVPMAPPREGIAF